METVRVPCQAHYRLLQFERSRADSRDQGAIPSSFAGFLWFLWPFDEFSYEVPDIA